MELGKESIDWRRRRRAWRRRSSKKEQIPDVVIFFPGNRPGCSPFFFVLVNIAVDQWY